MIYDNILELVGNTPVVKLNKLSKELNNEIYAKLEKQNPAGSSKDRISLYIIRKLFKEKKINDNTTIIEATSGNTGIGLAMVCAYYDLKLIITMSESVTFERIKLLESYGAQVILTKKEDGIEGAINKAKELHTNINNSYYIDQFNNVDNLICHYETTALEILNDFDNNLDAIVIGMGSSGTIMGISKKIKEMYNIKIVGVEPYGCPYYSKKEKGNYLIPGIGTTFMPKITDVSFIDEIITIKDQSAKYEMYNIMKKEGISAGLSSGAVLAGIKEYIELHNMSNRKLLVILPDSIEKYFSIL